MYLNLISKTNSFVIFHVKPGHEMYLNIEGITPISPDIQVKPGHEMYLNKKNKKTRRSGKKLNQDMRCI